MTSQLSAVKNSQRKYCNLLLKPFYKDEWKSQSERPIDDEILQIIKNIFRDTVWNVKLIRLDIRINVFSQLLTSLKGLKSVSLEQVFPVDKDDNSDASVDEEFDLEDQEKFLKKFK